ncbi:MAG: A/G-specific adenine glycosylase, partial [Oscillospiraceae bacterium]|nr:A/G-specific adenine glycosylase [Oscillospiraceae bacterium]
MEQNTKILPQQLVQLPDALIPWYQQNARSLPWRIDREPYHVWLSEIMLQQTRVEAVKPYYIRFLKRLPTLRALSLCDEETLMKLWEGLGYYSRARNLRRAAKQIMEAADGVFPSDYESLRRLPGVGEYTAGAIASICYDLPEPAVDGNVLRVIMRLCADESDIAAPETKKNVTAALREVYPEGAAASTLTEAIMELGENICIPNGMP